MVVRLGATRKYYERLRLRWWLEELADDTIEVLEMFAYLSNQLGVLIRYKLTLLGRIATIISSICCFAQSPEQQYLGHLNQFRGNKVFLIGDWPVHERNAWARLANEEGIFEFDISIFDAFTNNVGTWSVDSHGFEKWIIDNYAYRNSRWVLLNGQHQTVAYGEYLPEATDLVTQFENAGLVTPINQLRNFLLAHPDHIEARSDLLKQLMHRAIKLQTAEIQRNNGEKKQLGPEADLISWASLAQEVDVAFRGNWHGIEVPFFRADEEDQAEQYSPIMKSVFSRHIDKLETALMELPNSQSLWNIWAWMARGLENRDWKRLLTNLDAFTYPGGLPCPAPNVAVWLTREARAEGDWEQVVKLAKVGMYYFGDDRNERGEWFPGGWLVEGSFQPLDGYPITSAYMPMLEGLLQLHCLDDANAAFENVLFLGGGEHREAMVHLANNAGYTNLAQDWRTKKPRNSMQRLSITNMFGKPILGLPTIVKHNSRSGINPLSLTKIPTIRIHREVAVNTFGWPEAEEWWALLDNDNRLAIEGEGALQEDSILGALDNMGYIAPGKLARDYLRDHPGDIYAQYVLASELGINAVQNANNFDLSNAETLDEDQDNDLYGEFAKILRAYCESDSKLTYLSVFDHLYKATNSHLMKNTSEAILPKLEALLKQKPMSDRLWGSWVQWRRIGGDIRPFVPLLEELIPSPLVPLGLFPPAQILDEYYRDCVSHERWTEAAKLLRLPWDRELAFIDSAIKRKGGNDFPSISNSRQIWGTGKLLITALLHDGMLRDAEDVVEAWTSRGGKFEDALDIIRLARKLEYESLADRWEKMLQ